MGEVEKTIVGYLKREDYKTKCHCRDLVTQAKVKKYKGKMASGSI
jgi:hypothetical protein